jgi:anti-sigma B factor antagonist
MNAMNLDFHSDPLTREELIVKYLGRRLDPAGVAAFEAHYLECGECFEELRTSDLIRRGLAESAVAIRREGDVLVLGFSGPTQLTRPSTAPRQLFEGILQNSDSKVLVDLSTVSRIDSAGLGLLIKCYSHALRNRGMFKLLKPSQEVRQLFRLTRMDSVLETYDDEKRALESFSNFSN